MRQYLEIKDKYEDTIIFFRLGDFYEMFFEDAVIACRELELTLTGRNAGLDERVPMCGIPFKAYEGYLDKLIDKGYKVAIVEQLEDPKTTKDMVKRDVIQVVTKGTRLDSSINAKDNNFIASIYDLEYCYVLSYSDVSTGEVYVLLENGDKDALLREVLRHNFSEIIVNNKIDREFVNVIRTTYHLNVTIYDELYSGNEYNYVYKNLKDIREETGIKHLLAYLTNTKKGDLSHLIEAKIENTKEHLLVDNNTKRNLELTKND